MITYAVDSPIPTPSKALDIKTFMKKFSARRVLRELGTNDSEVNLRMAEGLFTVSADQFAKKWNFDPINFTPLSPGRRYKWVKRTHSSSSSARQPLKPTSSRENEATGITTRDITSDLCFPGRWETRLICCTRLHTPSEGSRTGISTKNSTTIESQKVRPPRRSSKHRLLSTTPKHQQIKITEFGRQRKWLHLCSKNEDNEIDSDSLCKHVLLSSSTVSK